MWTRLRRTSPITPQLGSNSLKSGNGNRLLRFGSIFSPSPLLFQSPSSPVINGTAAFDPGWRFYAAFLSTMLLSLAAALDSTSLGVALPTIAQKLKGTAAEAFWCGTSFFLSSTVVQPNFAALSHIFGRKSMVYGKSLTSISLKLMH